MLLFTLCLNVRQSEIFIQLLLKGPSNFVRVPDVCSEMSSDSKNYFDSQGNEFSELVHTLKSLDYRHFAEL